MSFLYFLPGRGSKEFDADFDFTTVGLPSLNRLTPLKDIAVSERSLNDRSGVFLAPYVSDGKPPSQTSPHPSQKWFDFEFKGQPIQVATVNGEVPKLRDLQRSILTDGYEIADASGRKWRVPIARGEESTLTKEFTFDVESGEPVVSPLRGEMADLWEATAKVWDWLGDDEASTVEIPEAEQVKIALQALRINYNIGPVEMNVFAKLDSPVFNENFVTLALIAICDWQVKAAAKDEDESKKN
jgi:hypothetical protein